MRQFLIAAISVLALAGAALAVEPDEMLPDPVQEARAEALSKTLRCMVCQNQSIEDSAAPLARDLRIIVREHIKAGETDQQIRDYLVARYGEFVLLEPRLSTHTIVLWAVPFGVLAIGLLWIALRIRSGNPPQSGELSGEEKRKIAELIEKSKDLTKM